MPRAFPGEAQQAVNVSGSQTQDFRSHPMTSPTTEGQRVAYVIVQTGVYRHEIRGAFEDFEAAKAAAESACRLETDAHHTWTVLEVSPTAETDLGGFRREVLNREYPQTYGEPVWIP